MARLTLPWFAGIALLSLGLALLTPESSFACATVETPSFTPQTYIAAERAVIIWDSVHHIEHFIRQASFNTDSPDIGFLVPTPATPELAVANPQIFEMSASLAHPSRIAPTNYHTPWTIVSPVITNPLLRLAQFNPAAFLSGFTKPESAPGKPAVVAEQDVAHYHATTLAADDKQSLSTWFKTNGYLPTPEFIAWLKPYADAHWKITAFKLIKNADGIARMDTAAIRLSFPTDQPFYPYSEPSDRRQANAASPLGRALQVAVLSDERVLGTLANHTPWPGKLEFAGSSNPSLQAGSAWKERQWLSFAHLDDPAHQISLPKILTTLIDESNPRPGTADLYFSPDPNQSSFQGPTVDLSLPPQNRIVLSHTFADLAALLLMIMLPAAPIYCGWQVLKLEPAKALRLNPWLRLARRIIGAYAIILGVYYGIQFILVLTGQLTAAYLGWSTIDSLWFWTLAALLLASMLMAAMSWGVIYCGVNVWQARTANSSATRQSRFFQADGGAWQGFMAASSLLVGSVLLLGLMSVLFPLLNL